MEKGSAGQGRGGASIAHACPDPPRMRRTLRGAGRRGTPCYISCMGKLSPIESEFESTEDAEAYERWFRAKVEASLKDPRPAVPHATVMAELDAIIDEAERRSEQR